MVRLENLRRPSKSRAGGLSARPCTFTSHRRRAYENGIQVDHLEKLTCQHIKAVGFIALWQMVQFRNQAVQISEKLGVPSLYCAALPWH